VVLYIVFINCMIIIIIIIIITTIITTILIIITTCVLRFFSSFYKFFFFEAVKFFICLFDECIRSVLFIKIVLKSVVGVVLPTSGGVRG